MRWIVLLILLSSFVLAQPIDTCNGCNYNGKCISYKSQIVSQSRMVYCSQDSKLYQTKPDSNACSENYECLSFLCSNGVCQPSNVEPVDYKTSSSLLLYSIIAGLVLFLLIFFFLVKFRKKSKRTTIKESKNTKNSESNANPSTVKMVVLKKKYNQFEDLDKKLDETTKKIIRK